MTDLAEFLLARIEEREEAAKRVHQPYRLYACDDGHIEEPMRVGDRDPWTDRANEYEQWADGDDRLPNHHNSWALIYDPARVIAECEAKRRIVELHARDHECSEYGHRGEVNNCAWVIGGDCSTMCLLALPLADHPDYREEWRV